MGRTFMNLRLAAVCAVMLLPPVAAAKTPAPSCDRRCLLHTLTEYTEAVTDNDASRLPLAPTVRATFNGVEGPFGKGEVWGAGRRLPYRQAFVDPATGSAVFYGIVSTATRTDKGRWWFYVSRLKVKDR